VGNTLILEFLLMILLGFKIGFISIVMGIGNMTPGLQFKTLDNPDWYLIVELEETELENLSFEDLKIDRSDNDWIRCKNRK